jgi:Dimerisation domain
MNAPLRQWHPEEVLEVSEYFWKTCTLHTAVALDVFTRIGEGRLSSQEVSARLNAAPKAVERLLNAPVAMELLAKVDGTDFNIPSGKELLSKDSPKYLGHIIMPHRHLLESWSKLDPVRSIRATGQQAFTFWQ